ncbi:hypothetical protein LCGC14_0736560 [marine sediment metagenome]|uniref:Uncharacterized protein n=1 Tax=marine sediment metagenome TaxID=412755 RepID=A0A0F9TF48_9ZZZZ
MAKKVKEEPKVEDVKIPKKKITEMGNPNEKVWSKEFDDKLADKYHITIWKELEAMFKPFSQNEIRKRAKELNL